MDEDGTVHGGPVYYITTRLQGQASASSSPGFFAVAIILALGFMGCMVQSNSIGETFSTAFGIPTWIMGVVLVAILAASSSSAACQRLAAVTEKIVPIMAAALPGSDRLVVLIMHACQYVPATFAHDLPVRLQPRTPSWAAPPSASSLKTPSARAPSAACSPTRPAWAPRPTPTRWPRCSDPHEQGVVAMIGVFIDTFVVVTMTALVVHLHALRRVTARWPPATTRR